MSRNYLDIPLEVRNKIKERIIEAGNEYDEKFIIDWYSKYNTIPGSSNNGFTYHASTEGMDFWADVINAGKHDAFFEKYPERYASDESLIFIEDKGYPDEKVGTQYLCITGQYEGETVTLVENDNTWCPYFKTKTCLKIDIAWYKLQRIAQTTSMDKQVSISETSDKFEDKPYPDEVVGTEYIVCKENDYFALGSTVKLYRNDNSKNPLFKKGGNEWFLNWSCVKRKTALSKQGNYRIKTLEEFGGKRPYHWNFTGRMDHLYGHVLTAKEVKEYLKGDSRFNVEEWSMCGEDVVEIVNNLNLNIQQNGSKESNTSSNTFLSRIPAAVTTGQAPRGTAISSSRGKVLMGS